MHCQRTRKKIVHAHVRNPFPDIIIVIWPVPNKKLLLCATRNFSTAFYMHLHSYTQATYWTPYSIFQQMKEKRKTKIKQEILMHHVYCVCLHVFIHICICIWHDFGIARACSYKLYIIYIRFNNTWFSTSAVTKHITSKQKSPS